jgi:hypothetical protein
LLGNADTSETLTDILGSLDETEGEVDFHGDEDPDKINESAERK